MELIIIMTRDKDEFLKEAAKPSMAVISDCYHDADGRVTLTVSRIASQEEAKEHARRRMEAGYADALKVFSS